MKFNALAFLLIAGIAGIATPAEAARASNQQVSLATLRGSNHGARRMNAVTVDKKDDSEKDAEKGKGKKDDKGSPEKEDKVDGGEQTRTTVDEEKAVEVETTASPTKAATDAPTVAVTDAPTKAATGAPTVTVTDAPTNAPTGAPTVAATDSPTASPTAGATTLEPTAKATNATTPETRTIDNEGESDVKLETSTGGGSSGSASKSSKKKEKDDASDELETRAKEDKNDKNKQVSTGGGDPEGESRLANCAARGNAATIAPKSVDNWMSLVMGGDLCSSDCECASGCCGWFWVRMCVNPSMQGMKCMGDAKQQIAQGEVPGTGGNDQGSDEGSQATLVVATPTGGADDIPGVNPPVPEEAEDMPAKEEFPAEPEMTTPEGNAGGSTIESTPFYNDISTGPEEKKGETLIYPIEKYPEGYPNAPATPATGKQPEMPNLAGPAKKGGSKARPGRNSGADATESKEGPGTGAGPAAENGADTHKSGSGPKKGGRDDKIESQPGDVESKEAMVAGPGDDKSKPGKAGPGMKGGPGVTKGGSGPAGGAGATTGGAKGAKPDEAKQGAGEKQKKDNDKDKPPTVGGGQSAEGVSRLPACAARGNVPTIEPKSVDNWTGLIMGGDRCNDNCECASGCCGWFWVRMCVNPSMQGMKCMADKAVSRTDGEDEELTAPEEKTPEVAAANTTETVIEIIPAEDEEAAEDDVAAEAKSDADDGNAVENIEESSSVSASKGGSSRSKVETGAAAAKAADEGEGLENKTSDGENGDDGEDGEDGDDDELIDNYDFSNGWPGWNDDKCQHSYQCKSGCCAWAHSNVCMDERTWMGRFACIA